MLIAACDSDGVPNLRRQGMMSGWNVKHEFGVAFTTNTVNSLNCSHQRYNVVDSSTRLFFVDALCPAYDEVLQVRGLYASVTLVLCASLVCSKEQAGCREGTMRPTSRIAHAPSPA